MNRNEIAVLRTQLRALNIEYSALVRGRGEDTRERMEKLRADRRALMAQIAQQRLEGREHHTAVASAAGAVPLPARRWIRFALQVPRLDLLLPRLRYRRRSGWRSVASPE
jgi:hypothetical protein